MVPSESVAFDKIVTSEPVPKTELTEGEVTETEGALLLPGLGEGVGEGLGVGVGVGVGIDPEGPKYKPLSTAVLAPVRVTTSFTRPRISQTKYCPPLKDEIDLVSSKAPLAQSTTSILCVLLFPSQSRQ